MNDLNITISETAAKIILNTIEDQTVSDPYLAFYVVGGGCSGLQYGLALAEGEPEIDDIIVYDKNIKIAVENSSAKYVNGCVIDYQENGMQSGFKVENPNAAKTCGCSKSFSVDGEEHDTCGGCGYK
jgi:iron-sulfur cluster assembly protein